jgi:nucleoside 2-deoxyribosyltransferase
MSFSGETKIEDAYDSFKEVCEEYNYQCTRINDANAINRIVPEIMANIKKSAFIIVDLTEERANVYYELGYAQGLNKPVIVTAFKDTPLPFDLHDIPTIFWDGQRNLKTRLREKIEKIASSQGR